jgi:ankyrin repeat protein
MDTILSYFDGTPFKNLIEIYGFDFALDGITPLMAAAATNNTTLIHLLCITPDIYNKKANPNKFTTTSALHVAVLCNHLEAVKFLLYLGADANIRDIDNDTPLHIAVLRKYCEITEYLVLYGAKIEKTPFDENLEELLKKLRI